jgi:hypothetical protein
VTMLHFPPRETLAAQLERSRKLHKVHVVAPEQQPLDPETWARRKMDDAVAIYREILGAAALKTRLQRVLEDVEQPTGKGERD